MYHAVVNNGTIPVILLPGYLIHITAGLFQSRIHMPSPAYWSWYMPCTNPSPRRMRGGGCAQSRTAKFGHFYANAGVVLAAAAIMVGGTLNCAAQADNANVSIRRASERTSFGDDEIKDGFFKTAFRAELQFDRRQERIRKFDEPVRVFVISRGVPDRRAEIARIIADIRAHVDHLDLAMTDDRQAANFVVTLVQSRDLRGRSAPTTEQTGRSKFNNRCIRSAFQASAKIAAFASAAPRRSCRSMPENLRSMTAPMKNCCKHWGSSMMTVQCPGPCSTTTSRWDSSTFTISTCSIFFTTRGLARHDQRRS